WFQRHPGFLAPRSNFLVGENPYLIVEPLGVTRCTVLQMHISQLSCYPFGFGLQRCPVNLNRLLTEVLLARSIPQHSKLAVPVDNAFITTHARFMRVGGAKTLRDLGHRLAVAGHELGEAA